jgi:hypothetical protein
MEKDAVANELANLEEQLSTSKAQIASLSETLEKQKDKVVQDDMLYYIVPGVIAELWFYLVKYAVALVDHRLLP